MYQISRSIYREIEADIVEGKWGEGPTNHERVLRACESAVFRLTTDRDASNIQCREHAEVFADVPLER